MHVLLRSVVAMEGSVATDERAQSTGPGMTDAWRRALATRRSQLAGDASLPAAAASRRDRAVPRRRFLLGSFALGVGVSLLGSVGAFLDYIYPRNARGIGGPVAAGNVDDYPAGGNPKHFPVGQFYLVNLDPDDTRNGESDGGAGLLALWHRCPHLGCTVPWLSSFSWEDERGWFRCPCHRSTYTKAGVRVFGPAPRSMDTMRIEVGADGEVVVQTGEVQRGGPDNPTRAV